MSKIVLFTVGGLLALVHMPVVAAQEKVEPLIDIARDTRAGASPSQVSIEKAYSECLKGVDAEFAEIKSGMAFRKEARKAEEEVCHRARRECVSNPSSTACKGFVVDYAE